MSLVPPTSPVGVAGTAPTATVGTLVNAPESLKAVDPGTIVKGTVEGRDRQGNMIVRTDQGAVTLRTAANFRPGTALTMEVRAVGDSQQVVILSVDRKAAPVQQPTQQPLPQQPVQQPGQPLQQPAQQTAQQPLQPGTQPPPTQAAGQPGSAAPAAPSAPAQPAPATPAPQQPAVSVAYSPIIAASTQPPQPLQAGQTVQALLLQTLTGQVVQGSPGTATAAAAQPGAAQPGPIAQGGTAAAASATAPAPPPQVATPQTPLPAGAASTPAAATNPTVPAPGAASPNNTVPTTGSPPPTTPNMAAAPQTPAPQGSPTQTGIPQPGPPQTGTPQSGIPQTGTSPAAASAAPAAPTTPAPSSAAPAPSGQPVLPPSLTTPAAHTATAAPPAGAPATQILQALPAGSTFAVTVNGVLPPAPGQATAPTPGLQPLPNGGATLTATVVGSTAAGQPLLQTSFGLVTIPGAQGLPAGTGVTLGLSPAALGEVQAAARAALGLSAGGASGAATAATGQPGGLSRSWPALSEAFVQLSQISPALAQTLLQTAIPQPGQQLAGALLFFMAALRGGDVRGWMGDQAARALAGRDGRSPLLARLGEDMGQMTRTGTDAAGNEWRGFYIPLFDGRDLQQIRLFMRDPAEEGEGGKDGTSGHRFLIDLDLSKLGALQLDGLARAERLDLIVRTHRALPRDIKAEIVRLFGETAERVGLKGQVSFQATPHFPPLPFVERNEIIEIHGEIEA